MSERTFAPDPGDLATQIKRLAARAHEAGSNHDLPSLLASANALLAVPDEALGRADPGATRDLLDVALPLLSVNELALAEGLLAKGIRAHHQNPKATLCDRVCAYSNYMAVQHRKGDLKAVNQMAAAICKAAHQMTEPVTSRAADVFVELAQLYENSQSIEPALLLYHQVHRRMTEDKTVDSKRLQEWTSVYVSKLCEAQKYQEAQRVGQAVLDRIAAEHARYEGASVKTAAWTSNAAGALGDETASMRWLERAVAIAEDLEQRNELVEPGLVALASAVHHNLATKCLSAQSGEMSARAEGLLRRSLHYVLQQGKQGTAEHAGELAQLAQAVELRGDLAQAEQLYLQAIGIYEKAPDKTTREQADFVGFLNDLGGFQLKQERPADAIAPLRRAVELHETVSADLPLLRANAHSSLALAYFKAAQWEKASESSLQAIELRLTSSAPIPQATPSEA